MSIPILPTRITKKCKPSKLLPLEPGAKSPGRIFESNKGTPPFCRYFHLVYDDFLKKTLKENLNSSIKREAQELSEIAENLFLHYRIKLLISNKGDNILKTLSFLNTLLKVISSLSEELVLKPELFTIYIDNQNYSTINQDQIVDSNEKFAFSVFETEENITQKVSSLLRNMPSKPQEYLWVLPSDIKQNLDIPSKVNLAPDGCLRSCLKGRSFSVFSPTCLHSLAGDPKMNLSINSFPKAASRHTTPKGNTRRVSFGGEIAYFS